MSRKTIIAGNWKMHVAPTILSPDSIGVYQGTENVQTIVFPTYLDLPQCLDQGLPAGGQFAHPLDSGARTGDISMQMLADTGAKYVMCGHSERRIYHHETDEFVAQSAVAALSYGITPVICIGETWEEKEAGNGESVVRTQLETVLRSIEDFSKEIIVAYEPVWAISGGDANKPAATPEDAQKMHEFIRSLLPSEIQASTRILYGGSMKPENAEALLAQADIDGGLVGGASLVPEKFQTLVDIAQQS